MRSRLAEGGIATYWLPVAQLRAEETKGVLRAFLDAFGETATLRTGAGLEWIPMGTRGAVERPSLDVFAAHWRDPEVALDLELVGFEHPEQLDRGLPDGRSADLRFAGGEHARRPGVRAAQEARRARAAHPPFAERPSR